MDQRFLINLLERGIEVEPGRYEQVKIQLAIYISGLITRDFSKLVELLYRCDIDEQKLKQVLQSHKETDSSFIIAELVLKRQRQKLHQRKKFDKPGPIAENEKW